MSRVNGRRPPRPQPPDEPQPPATQRRTSHEPTGNWLSWNVSVELERLVRTGAIQFRPPDAGDDES